MPPPQPPRQAPATLVCRCPSQQQQQQQQHAPPGPPPQPQPPGEKQPSGDLELHNEIRACEQWRDVLDVIADEASNLTPRVTVQALSRLASLSKKLGRSEQLQVAQQPAFQNLVSVLHQQVPAMNPVQLSSTLFFLQQLGVEVPTSMLQQVALQVSGRGAWGLLGA